MLVLVVNNSLTPSLRNDLQLEGTGPCGYYALISSSPVPLPPEEKEVRRCSHGFARRISSSSGLGDLGRRSYGRNRTLLRRPHLCKTRCFLHQLFQDGA